MDGAGRAVLDMPLRASRRWRPGLGGASPQVVEPRTHFCVKSDYYFQFPCLLGEACKVGQGCFERSQPLLACVPLC